MTKSECRSEIARNQNLIGQYEEKICQLQIEISELQISEEALTELRSDLFFCKSASTNELERIDFLNKINDRIVSRFYDGMEDILSGSLYQDVNSGLGSGIERIESEITNKLNEITTCGDNITSCRDRIQQMNSEIARIEEEKVRTDKSGNKSMIEMREKNWQE